MLISQRLVNLVVFGVNFFFYVMGPMSRRVDSSYHIQTDVSVRMGVF